MLAIKVILGLCLALLVQAETDKLNVIRALSKICQKSHMMIGDVARMRESCGIIGPKAQLPCCGMDRLPHRRTAGDRNMILLDEIPSRFKSRFLFKIHLL